MVASIGHQICIDRDWVPEIFRGDALTSVNAWVRRIDQFAMLAGPVIASLAIDHISPWVGGIAIAVWNILSVFVEYYFMKKIYNFFPSLSEKETPKEQDESGMADWITAYSHWYTSPVFLPGLALAILYSNIFQLSYLAQAYSTSHCVTTIWYESWVKSYGLTKVAILGAILHFSFVIITVVGLFVPGSMYMFYLGVSSADQCPQQLNETALAEYEFKPTTDDNWITDFTTPCTPPDNLLSILLMLFACALSRVGLWTFDLAVNQMFQEWVDVDKRGKVSGAQNGIQYVFDCVHYGLIFVWSSQCEYGHGVIVTAILMLIGYGRFVQHGLTTNNEHEALPTDEKPTSREDVVLEC
ncbi:Oidioi.mRNA.OKI2018_I69.chr1.g3276.t1.cds [Oikopleura dioica]|uniref:Solute carrier family 40 member n=1 Tax=Oikopleura dioica TaxID=34765 RepID=A0ABN7T2T8_OIKDI|nr:Oidioi.mRNA.OKI2018_I69.chr1.g3276.t1.cds [Oikopleura dioica]